MKKVGHFPGSEYIQKWLKAGYVEFGKLYDTNTGTPQGGVISPLLANIALDGIQSLLSQFTYIHKYESGGKTKKQKRQLFGFARYADDFVVTSQFREELEKLRPILEEWLAKVGLKLNEEKTKIVDIKAGFDFLGFNIRHVAKKSLVIGSKKYFREKKKAESQGKTLRRGTERGEQYYACHVTPSQKKIESIKEDVRNFLRSSGSREMVDIIKTLNSKLRGWGIYFGQCVSSKVFNHIDNFVWNQVWCFVQRRHEKKGKKWLANRYFTRFKNYKWNLYADYPDRRGYTKRVHLIRLSRDIPRTSHVQVKQDNAIDDPTLVSYWNKRIKDKATKSFRPKTKYRRVVDRQNGKCPICGHPITDEAWDVHHIVPIKDGGTDDEKNLMIVHKSCHQAKHKKLHYKDDITDTETKRK